MIELSPGTRKSFNADGFVIVGNPTNPDREPTLHRAFSDLFNGCFETGVRAGD